MKLFALLAALFSVQALAASPPFILPPQGGNAGKVLGTNGTNPSWVAQSPAGVTSVTASAPVASSGGTTPNISLPAATGSVDGYLSHLDFGTFNSKEPAIAAGLSTQYWRGDKTWQILSTSVVPEGSSLYFTTARAQGAVSASSPLTYSLGVFGCQAASGSQAGCLSSSDWSLFNSKQSALTFGSISTSTTGVTVGSGSSSTVGPNVTVNIQTATDGQPGLLSAADHAAFNAKQSAGSYVTAGTGDASFSGPGSAAVTVNSVGGSLAADVHAAELAANAATNLNTASAIVKRDASGNFSAGTITASLSGNATSATTATSATSATTAGSATNFTGSLSGDVTGTQSATVVSAVGGSTANNVHLAEVAANAATSLATANSIMKRDSGSAVSGTFNYTPTTPGDWSWTTTPTTHGGALDSISNWIKNVATNLSNLLDTRTLYVSKTALLASDSNSCSYFLPCLTIQRGINVANGLAAYYKQVTVRVSPGTTSGAYTENLTLSQQGVNLVCDSPQTADRRCNLVGTITVNLTGTSGGAQFIAASNEVYIHGMVTTAGAGNDAITFSGSTWQRLVASHCYFQASSGHAAVVSNNGFTSGTPSEFRSYDTTFENNSATIPTVLESAGRFWLYGTTPTVQNDNASGPSFLHNPTATTTGNLTSGSACIASPGSLTGIAVGQTISDTTSLGNSVNITAGTKVLAIPGTCSAGQIQMSANAAGSETGATLNFGGSSMIANITQFVGQYQLADNTATATFNLSTIASGTASCISTPTIPNAGYALIAYFGCNSSNTNSITGSGIVVNAPGNARFGSSGDIASTVTQSNIGPGLPQGEVMIGNGATTGTNVLLSILNGHVKVSQTTAPTASPSANAGTSATCTLTNGRDSSGIINLTEGSGSWASGTQCTVTFNKAWGVSPNCVVTPHNAAAASHLVSQQIFSTTTTTTLLLGFGVADSAATASQWSYKCEEP